MSVTDDPNDPRLTKYTGPEPAGPQADVYLVLSEDERQKGFVRPYRDSYVHVGPPGPTYELRSLTDKERELFGREYVLFESYPEDMPNRGSKLGKFWSQRDLDSVGGGCGVKTTMGQAIAETYARSPKFYGATYCCGCSKHLPVHEFVWARTTERVGS